MPIFTIVFERRNPAGNHDYQPLLQQLQAQKCFPLWETAWLGSFENNATQVHNFFKRLMADSDRLVVCEMSNHFCYSGVVQGANRWLELNPPSGGLDSVRVPDSVASAPEQAKAAAPAKAPAKKAPAKKAPPVKPAAKTSKAPVKKAPPKAEGKAAAPKANKASAKAAGKPATSKPSTKKAPAKKGGK